MANPIAHAQTTLDRVHSSVQPYMPALFNRLATNYALLIGLVLLINLVAMPLISRFVPLPSTTVNVLGFSAMLLVLVFGWRYLEGRNQATSLFVLYVRYSRQRRDLKTAIEQAEAGVETDENTLYVLVDYLEEYAGTFLQAVEEQGVQALDR